MKKRLILDLCGGTGGWSRPYAEDRKRYEVIIVDPVAEGEDAVQMTVQEFLHELLRRPRVPRVHGVLAAPPCTDFSSSGAWTWPAKDADGRTALSVDIVSTCLAIQAHVRPAWWALENPVGRLPRIIGPYVWAFHPWEFGGYLSPPGDAYTKRTCLWGSHAIPERKPVEPVRACAQGSWLQKLGGSSERTKRLRSATPEGFARAFKLANP